ncbi:E3 ubiquitin-protein ligase ZNRF4 isoform X1 [Dendrobium catenatum]|uniref:E3 ubiquitin-protein ligase ZNRF4 isoform X1 n=1 Tax=Dendrobium catenatum TaxID=906689 RepID=UPI00109F13C6|nr:E3 ubiquitin-protein ligase ZNRF4 isoform X1 [Dendrobium catenatum]
MECTGRCERVSAGARGQVCRRARACARAASGASDLGRRGRRASRRGCAGACTGSRAGSQAADLNGFPSHPHSPAQILIIEGTINEERVNPRLLQFIHESPPRIQGEWQLGFIPEPESSGLTDAEFNSAMKKLRKQTYDPPQLKRKAWRRGLFSSSNYVQGSNDEKNEDKKCTICLEPFVPKEQVLVTPCNHIFHDRCLTPWVKSHGQCPVCRFKLCERKEIIQTPNYNYNSNSSGNIYEDDLALDLITLVRAMEEALMWMRLS